MISLNDVLFAASNIPVDDPIAEIWGRGLQGGEYKIVEYTGTLPITINANGDALFDYRIYGADGGVGEPTENLWNPNSRTANQVGQLNWGVILPAGTYTIKNDSSVTVYFRDGVDTTTAQRFANAGETETKTVTNELVAWCNSSQSVIMLVEGSIAQTKYIPYGYKLPMVVRTTNMAWTGWVQDFIVRISSLSAADIQTIDGRTCLKYNVTVGFGDYDNKYIFKTGWKSNTQYTISFEGLRPTNESTAAIMQILYTDDTATRITANNSGNFEKYTITSSTNKTIKYITAFYSSGFFYIDIDTFMVNEGTIALPYIPYSRTDTPVYIGENQLAENEYVSYGEQKIYRDVNGTLTPTDPPVPLPKIPTIDETTVIDYDGDPKPSQMYVKYKDKGAQ